jgi:hypothetical protein
LYLNVWKRAVHSVCGRLYRDSNGDPRRSVMVAGTARSGTTWLAEIIASQSRSRIMFEPFHSRLVPGFRGFQYFQYMRPEESNDELLAYCRQVFSGSIRNRWIDREIEHLLPTYRVIKEIRANLFLQWAHRRFPEVPFVLILRHPCAVVASRMQLGWATDQDIESFLAQPKLLEDFLYDKLDLIRACRTAEEKHATIWCISYLVPLRQLPAGEVSIAWYERLCTQPATELPRILQGTGQGYRASLLDRLHQPSKTTVATSPVMQGRHVVDCWKRDLSSDQVRRILSVVERFGLGFLYDESPLPLIDGSNMPGIGRELRSSLGDESM